MTLEEMANALQEHCKRAECGACQFEKNGYCLFNAGEPCNWVLDDVNERHRRAVKNAVDVLREYFKEHGHSCKKCMFDCGDGCALACGGYPEKWVMPED